MWLAGAIGLAGALGPLLIAAIATFLAIMVLWILGRMQAHMDHE